MEEIWKDIPNYEGLYQASNLGRIRSVTHYDKLKRLHKGQILRPSYDGRKKYIHVTIKNKSINVHRLIALTFLPNPNKFQEVNHKDENKTNNRVENLEWCNRLYNNTYGSRRNIFKGENNRMSKLTNKEVKEIRKLKSNGISARQLSNDFNVSLSHVYHICKGNYWNE